MQYWYAVRGNSSLRGVADELVLFEMARNGRLKPTDLVWNTTTGSRWVPASTIEGLFPPIAQAGAADDAASVVPGSVQPDAGRRRSWMIPGIVTVVLVSIACMMAIVALKFVKVEKTLPKADFLSALEQEAMSSASTVEMTKGIAAVARSNVVASLRDRIAVCFVQDRLAEAEKLIADLRQTEGGAEFVQRLASRLEGLKRTALRKSELEKELKSGTLDKAGAEELVSIFRERREEAILQALTEDLLRDKSGITPAISLAAARLCNAAGWTTSEKIALREFAGRAAMSGPDSDYLEAVRMYSALGEPLKGADLLARYVTNAPQSCAAWLELAAIRCSAGDFKAGMTALRQAVDRGGNEACASARRDPRFDTVRDTRAFRSLIGIK